jgi:hypothetical protein
MFGVVPAREVLGAREREARMDSSFFSLSFDELRVRRGQGVQRQKGVHKVSLVLCFHCLVGLVVGRPLTSTFASILSRVASAETSKRGARSSSAPLSIRGDAGSSSVVESTRSVLSPYFYSFLFSPRPFADLSLP